VVWMWDSSAIVGMGYSKLCMTPVALQIMVSEAKIFHAGVVKRVVHLVNRSRDG